MHKHARIQGGGGANSATQAIFVLIGKGREDPNFTKMSHYRPACETPFKWRFAGVPMMAQH